MLISFSVFRMLVLRNMAYKIRTSSVLPAVRGVSNYVCKDYFNFRSGCLKAGNANVLFPRAPSSVISKVLIRLNLIKACQYDIELASQFLLNRIQNLDDRSENSRDSLESLNVLLLYLYF